MMNKPLSIQRIGWAISGLILFIGASIWGSLVGTAELEARQNALPPPPVECLFRKLYLPAIANDFLVPFAGPWEVEPNDTYLQANGPLISAATYLGYPNDDRDYFSIYLRSAGLITINLSNHTGQGVQLQLFYESTNNRVAFDLDAPFSIQHTGPAGWYYIYIFTASGWNSNTPYSLWATYPTSAQRSAPVADTPLDAWEEVGASSASGGGLSNTTGASRLPAAAVAPDCTPYVVWYDDSNGNTEIYGRRWDETSWQEVGAGSASGGGISNNGSASLRPSLAIAPDGTPYVAWHNNNGGTYDIYVRRWNAQSQTWEEVGSGSASGGGISNNSTNSFSPAIGIAGDGVVYVAWEDGATLTSEVYVRRWNGETWEEVGGASASGGGISNSAGNSMVPTIAFAPEGVPYVAWNDDTDGDEEIYVRRLSADESNWEEVGDNSAQAGGISDNDGDSAGPAIAMATDGTPYVVWRDNSNGNYDIYVRRWNETAGNWDEVTAGSASGGGISNSSGHSYSPTMAIAPDGTVYVAWDDVSDSEGDTEIYVRRWSGGDWEEVGVGSASAGGISNNSSTSSNPSLAVSPEGIVYAVWEDDLSGNDEIYVLRWVE
ncbi:MAG: hypothetical protein AB1791_04805 [Chloroflexota bacterium]